MVQSCACSTAACAAPMLNFEANSCRLFRRNRASASGRRTTTVSIDCARSKGKKELKMRISAKKLFLCAIIGVNLRWLLLPQRNDAVDRQETISSGHRAVRHSTRREPSEAESQIMKSGFALATASQRVKRRSKEGLNKKRAEFQVERLPSERIRVVKRFFVEERSKRRI